MSVRRRKDGRWGYDITKKVGGAVVFREKRFGFPTKKAASDAEDVRRASLLATGPSDAAPVKAITFAELSAKVMQLHAAVENKASEQASKESIFREHLVPFFGPTPIDKIDDLAIAAYKAAKLRPKAAPRPLAPKTINNHLTVLGKSLALAVSWKLLRSAPKVGFLRVPEAAIDFLTFDEAPALLAAADAGPWRTMILLGLRAGLRQGEILALRWSDVDLERGTIRVSRRIWNGNVDTPKGGRSRDVPISGELAAALSALASRAGGGLVFPSPEGERHLRKNECKWPLWRACRRAGLRRVGWHVLRHTFASHLVMRGVSLKAVQELLGHRDIKQTMRYAHLAPEVTRDAVSLLDQGPARGPQK